MIYYCIESLHLYSFIYCFICHIDVSFSLHCSLLCSSLYLLHQRCIFCCISTVSFAMSALRQSQYQYCIIHFVNSALFIISVLYCHFHQYCNICFIIAVSFASSILICILCQYRIILCISAAALTASVMYHLLH